MENYKNCIEKNNTYMGIIHAESQLPTNWFDAHGFFLIRF
jgi:hypothetical protein